MLIAADDGTLQWSEDAGATWQARASANGAVQASALALTADGLDAMVAPDGAKALRSEARRGMFATTEGTGGTLRGGSGARVELQYLGSGEWLLKKWLGTLLAE